MRRNEKRFVFIAASAALALSAPAGAAPDDAEFVKTAASGGMMEVELGKYATKHAADASVRAFGERMVADHTKANEELKTVAGRAGIPVPTQMEETHREHVQKLSKLKGAEFDKAYMEMMVNDHEQDVEAFREQAEEQKSDVDRWAAKTLPTLESHLQQAQTVAKKVEKADASGSRSGSSNMGGDAGRALDPSVTGAPARP
jgi:putative membrane protein